MDYGDKMSTQSEELTRRYRSIAALVASAVLITGSPTLVDRITNALSPEAVMRSISDSLRIVEGASRGAGGASIKEEKIKEGDKEIQSIVIAIREGGSSREYIIKYASLPSSETVREFLERIERDIILARKIGIVAQSMILESYKG